MSGLTVTLDYDKGRLRARQVRGRLTATERRNQELADALLGLAVMIETEGWRLIGSPAGGELRDTGGDVVGRWESRS